MKGTLPRRLFLAALAALYGAVNAVFPHAAEANFWADRKSALARGHAAEAAPTVASLAHSLPLDRVSRFPALPASPGDTLPAGFAADHAPLLKALAGTHGTVRRVAAPAGTGSRVVVHIQDVHMNADAQAHIGAAVAALLEAKAVGLVALEGAFSPLDAAPYRAFPDQAAVRGAADFLLRDNQISGPVHAALTAGGVIPFVGVDDRPAYGANVAAYAAAAPAAAPAKERLAALRADAEAQKAAVFSPALQAFDKAVQAHHQGAAPLGDYVNALVAQAPAVPDSVRDFHRALGMEAALDFKQVEAERSVLIQSLAKALPPARLEALVQHSAAYRAGQIRYGDFYRFLSALCRESGVPLSRTPAMDAYVRYVLLSDAVSPEKLFDDLAALEKSCYAALARTPEEKRLVALSSRLALAAKLLDFALTPQEWGDYADSAAPLSGLDLAPFEAFYKEAQARDHAMAANLLAQMDASGARTAALVTGGYHSPGIARALRRAGVAVIGFTPTIDKIDTAQGTAYLGVFTREKTPLEKMFQGEKLFLSPLQFQESAPLRTLFAALASAAAGAAQGAARVGELFAQIGGAVRVRVKLLTNAVRFDLSASGGAARLTVRLDGRGGISSVENAAGGFFAFAPPALSGFAARFKPASAWVNVEQHRLFRGHPRRLLLYRLFGVHATEPLWLLFYVISAAVGVLDMGVQGTVLQAAFTFLMAWNFTGIHRRDRKPSAFAVAVMMGLVFQLPLVGTAALGGYSIFASMAVHTLWNLLSWFTGLPPASGNLRLPGRTITLRDLVREFYALHPWEVDKIKALAVLSDRLADPAERRLFLGSIALTMEGRLGDTRLEVRPRLRALASLRVSEDQRQTYRDVLWSQKTLRRIFSAVEAASAAKDIAWAKREFSRAVAERLGGSPDPGKAKKFWEAFNEEISLREGGADRLSVVKGESVERAVGVKGSGEFYEKHVAPHESWFLAAVSAGLPALLTWGLAQVVPMPGLSGLVPFFLSFAAWGWYVSVKVFSRLGDHDPEKAARPAALIHWLSFGASLILSVSPELTSLLSGVDVPLTRLLWNGVLAYTLIHFFTHWGHNITTPKGHRLSLVSAAAPDVDTVRASPTAFSHADPAQDFQGIDLEHFVVLQRRLRSDENARRAAAAELKLPADTEEPALLAALAARGYDAPLVDKLLAGTYAPPRMETLIDSQSGDARAQSLYEAVSNSLDALGASIGQFGKGVKQALAWLGAGDRLDVFTMRDGTGHQLSIVKDDAGQPYIQIRPVSTFAVFQAAGRFLSHGTVLRVAVKDPIPLEESDDARPNTQRDLVEGLRRRFPFITGAHIATSVGGGDLEPVNGFHRKQVLYGPSRAAASSRGDVLVEVHAHGFTVVDDGAGMDALLLSRMFAGGAKTAPVLDEAAVTAALAGVQVVQDPGLPRRVSFARNGEVITALDLPPDLMEEAFLEGGSLLDLGPLMRVPESRGQIILQQPAQADVPTPFMRGVLAAAQGLVDNPDLDDEKKARAVNTLLAGLEALVQSNESNEHVVTLLKVGLRRIMVPVAARLEGAGFTLVPHHRSFAKLDFQQAGARPFPLHPALFDWKGAQSLKLLGGRVVPGLQILHGQTRLNVVVFPFTDDALRGTDAFDTRWWARPRDIRLPLLKTADFVAVPPQVAARLLALAQRRHPAEEAEFISLAEALNIATADKTVTGYELGTPPANIVILPPAEALAREQGFDAPAVNDFLAANPYDAAAGNGPAIPAGAQRFLLDDAGRLVDVGTGNAILSGIASATFLGKDQYLLVHADGSQTLTYMNGPNGPENVIDDVDHFQTQPNTPWLMAAKGDLARFLYRVDGGLRELNPFVDGQVWSYTKFQFSADGHYALYIGSARDPMTLQDQRVLVIHDLSDGSEKRVPFPIYGDITVSPNAPTALISNGGPVSFFVHLPSGFFLPVEQAITDPGGEFTTLVLPGGRLDVFIHQYQALLSTANLPGSIATVGSRWEGPDPVHYVEVGTSVLRFDGKGNVQPFNAFKEISERETAQGIHRKEILIVAPHETAPQGSFIVLGPGSDRPVLQKSLDQMGLHGSIRVDPRFPDFIYDRSEPGRSLLIDLRSGTPVFLSDGEPVNSSGTPKGAFVFARIWLKAMKEILNVIVDVRGGSFQNTRYHGFAGPAGEHIFLQPGGDWRLQKPGLLKPLVFKGLQAFRAESFDGRYFLLRHPSTGDVAYLDTRGGSTPVIVRSRAGLTDVLPPTAPSRVAVLRDAALKPFLQDLRSGQPVPLPMDYADIIPSSEPGVFIGTGYFRRAGALPSPDEILVPHRAHALRLDLSGPQASFRDGHPVAQTELQPGPVELQTTLRSTRGGFSIVADGAGAMHLHRHADNLTIPSFLGDPSREIHFSASGRYSVHLGLDGSLAYYDHEDPDVASHRVPIAAPGKFSSYFVSPDADVVILQTPGGYRLFNLLTRQNYPHLCGRIMVLPEGGFAVGVDKTGLPVLLSVAHGLPGLPHTLLSTAVTVGSTAKAVYAVSDAEPGIVQVYNRATNEISREPASSVSADLPPYMFVYANGARSISRRGGAAAHGAAPALPPPVPFADMPPSTAPDVRESLSGPLLIQDQPNAQVRITNLSRPPYPSATFIREGGFMKPLAGAGHFMVSLRGDGAVANLFEADTLGHYKVDDRPAFVDASERHVLLLNFNGRLLLWDGLLGVRHDVTDQVPAGYVPVGVNGDFFMLQNINDGKILYLHPAEMIASLTAAPPPAALEGDQKAGSALWKEHVVPAREGFISRGRGLYAPLLALAPDAARDAVSQDFLPAVKGLFASQQAGVLKRIQAAAVAAHASVDLSGLPFEEIASSPGLSATLAALETFIQDEAPYVALETAEGFQQAWYHNLLGAVFDLARAQDLPSEGLSRAQLRALALGWRRGLPDRGRDLAAAASFVDALFQASPVPSRGTVLKILGFLSEAVQARPEKHAVIVRQLLRLAAARPELLGRLASAFHKADPAALREFTAGKGGYQSLGDAVDYAAFLTEDVDEVKRRDRRIHDGREEPLPPEGVTLSQIDQLERMRLKPAGARGVMDVDYFRNHLDQLPAPDPDREQEYRLFAENQSESGAYTKEIAQNTGDAARDAGRPAALTVDFYRQSGPLGEEFVEEASDDGTGALQEMALLIEASTKSQGAQKERGGYFGTGKFTVFEGVDRLEYVTSKSTGEGWMFTFTVDRSDTGAVSAVRLTGLRRLRDVDLRPGVTVRRIKRASRVLPPLEQMLAQRAWRNFAGLAHGRNGLSIQLVNAQGRKRPLIQPTDRQDISAAAARLPAQGDFPARDFSVALIGTQDLPMQVVDGHGRRVRVLDPDNDPYLALVPPALRRKVRELNLSVQVSLPLIRTRNEFQNASFALPFIRRAVAAAVARALAHQALTREDPAFTFDGLSLDWATNTRYWDAIQPDRDASVLRVVGALNSGREDALSEEDWRALMPDGELDARKSFTKAVLLTKVPLQAGRPSVSLFDRRQEIMLRSRADLAAASARLVGHVAGPHNADGRSVFFDRQLQASARINELDKMDLNKVVVEPETPEERRLLALARLLARDAGLQEVRLVQENVPFLGLVMGDAMLLRRDLARDPARAVMAIAHELAHLQEKLMTSGPLKAGEIYLAHADGERLTHEAEGPFAEANKYLAARLLRLSQTDEWKALFPPAPAEARATVIQGSERYEKHWAPFLESLALGVISAGVPAYALFKLLPAAGGASDLIAAAYFFLSLAVGGTVISVKLFTRLHGARAPNVARAASRLHWGATAASLVNVLAFKLMASVAGIDLSAAALLAAGAFTYFLSHWLGHWAHNVTVPKRDRLTLAGSLLDADIEKLLQVHQTFLNGDPESLANKTLPLMKKTPPLWLLHSLHQDIQDLQRPDPAAISEILSRSDQVDINPEFVVNSLLSGPVAAILERPRLNPDPPDLIRRVHNGLPGPSRGMSAPLVRLWAALTGPRGLRAGLSPEDVAAEFRRVLREAISRQTEKKSAKEDDKPSLGALHSMIQGTLTSPVVSPIFVRALTEEAAAMTVQAGDRAESYLWQWGQALCLSPSVNPQAAAIWSEALAKTAEELPSPTTATAALHRMGRNTLWSAEMSDAIVAASLRNIQRGRESGVWLYLLTVALEDGPPLSAGRRDEAVGVLRQSASLFNPQPYDRKNLELALWRLAGRVGGPPRKKGEDRYASTRTPPVPALAYMVEPRSPHNTGENAALLLAALDPASGDRGEFIAKMERVMKIPRMDQVQFLSGFTSRLLRDPPRDGRALAELIVLFDSAINPSYDPKVHQGWDRPQTTLEDFADVWMKALRRLDPAAAEELLRGDRLKDQVWKKWRTALVWEAADAPLPEGLVSLVSGLLGRPVHVRDLPPFAFAFRRGGSVAARRLARAARNLAAGLPGAMADLKDDRRWDAPRLLQDLGDALTAAPDQASSLDLAPALDAAVAREAAFYLSEKEFARLFVQSGGKVVQQGRFHWPTAEALMAENPFSILHLTEGEALQKFFREGWVKGAQVVGVKPLLRFLGRAREAIDITTDGHGPIFTHVEAFLQTLPSADRERFLKDVLPAVAMDESEDEQGNGSRRVFASLCQHLAAMDGGWRNALASFDYGVDEINALRNNLLAGDDLFGTWRRFKKLSVLWGLHRNQDALRLVATVKKDGEDGPALAAFLLSVLSHPAMPDLEAVTQLAAAFLQGDGNFFAREDNDTDEDRHELKSPARLFEFPFIDLTPRDLARGLVLGRLDAAQSFPPFVMDVFPAMDLEPGLDAPALLARLAGHKDVDLASLKAAVLACAAAAEAAFPGNVKAAESLNRIRHWTDAWGSVPRALRNDRLAPFFSLESLLAHGLIVRGEHLRFRVLPKSDSRAVTLGNETPTCMGAGTGKSNVYWTLPTTGLSSLSRVTQADGLESEKVFATGVLTHDLQLNEPKRTFQQDVWSADGLTGILGDGTQVHLAVDNIEASTARRAGADRELFVRRVRDAFSLALSAYRRAHPTTPGGRPVNPSRAVVGLHTMDAWLTGSLPKEANHFLPLIPLPYTDKNGENVGVLYLDAAPPPASVPAAPPDGLRPLLPEDTLEAALLSARLRGGNIQARLGNELTAAVYNDLLKGADRRHVSRAFFEGGRMVGYVVAYVGLNKDTGVPVMHVSDMVAPPSRPAIGAVLRLAVEQAASELSKGRSTPMAVQPAPGLTAWEAAPAATIDLESIPPEALGTEVDRAVGFILENGEAGAPFFGVLLRALLSGHLDRVRTPQVLEFLVWQLHSAGGSALYRRLAMAALREEFTRERNPDVLARHVGIIEDLLVSHAPLLNTMAHIFRDRIHVTLAHAARDNDVFMDLLRRQAAGSDAVAPVAARLLSLATPHSHGVGSTPDDRTGWLPLQGVPRETVDYGINRSILKGLWVHRRDFDSKLTLDLARGLPDILSDDEDLPLIWLSLYSNALDALKAAGSMGPRISIVSEDVTVENARYVQVTFSDNGPGIPPEMWDGPVFQWGKTTKGADGTGRGLLSVKRHMDAIGGTIDVRSTPGRGAAFVLRFPVPSSPAGPDSPPTVQAPGTGPGGASAVPGLLLSLSAISAGSAAYAFAVKAGMALSPALLIAALSVGLLIALWRGFRALISARQGAQARRRAASAARTLDALLEDRPVPAGADDALIPFEPTWKVSALDAQGVVRARLAATLPALLADGSSRADLEKRLTARPSASAVVAALLGTDPSKVQVLTRVVGGGIRERVAARALAARINALNDPRLQLVLAPRDASVDLSGMAGGQVRVLSRPVADGQGQLNPAALNAQFDALAKAQKWTETTADVRLALPADVEFSLSTADLDALALNPALKEALKAFLLAPLAPLRLEQTLESAAVIAQFA